MAEMEGDKEIWTEWFARHRVVAPADLSFRLGGDALVVLLRKEPFYYSLTGKPFVFAILLLFVSVAIFGIDQIGAQVAFIIMAIIGAYAYAARTRITVNLSPLSLVAETRHFGYITEITTIAFRDAHFIARPVGGFQNIEDELVFTDGTQSYFCFFVTTPSAFEEILREVNSILSDRVVPNEHLN